MFALALTASLLAASPEASVVVARRIGLEAKRGEELAQQLTDALRARDAASIGALVDVSIAVERLAAAGFPDTAVCNGAATCVASLAKVGVFRRLVALQLVKLGAELAVDASVVDGDTGQVLAAITRTVSLKTSAEEWAALAAELTRKLSALDAPIAVVLPGDPADARPKNDPPEVHQAPGLGVGRKVALGFGGGAVVALGVGIGLGVSAAAQASQLSVLDPMYAQRVAGARGTALGADLSYVTAGAFAVTALLLWLFTP
jgi:hypothetical protein